jgi:GTP-binding protein YchF
MELGLIGLARSGKTTLFEALSGLRSAPGVTPRGARNAAIRVPDPRVDRLAALFRPRRTTWAEVTFVDPGGAPAETATRAPLPEAMATELASVDALVHVVRAFDAPSVPRAQGSTTPAGDVETVEQELVLRDLGVVERRLERMRKERAPNSAEQDLLERAFAHLENGRPLRDLGLSEDQAARLRGYQFLSLKPAMVVLNVGEEDLKTDPGAGPGGLDRFRVLRLCATVEREIGEIEPAEQRAFLADLGLEEPARDVFVRAAYTLLDLVSFFTVGEDEVRAWRVRAGSTALVAAGKIHSDIARGFIRGEAIHYEELLRVGSLTAAKAQGVLRLEGKEYRVQDGDILHFRFSV